MGTSPSRSSEHRDSRSTDLNYRDPHVANEADVGDIRELNDRYPSVASKRSDICGTDHLKFIIQSGARFVQLTSLANDIPVTNVTLKEECKNGDHYLARYSSHGSRDSDLNLEGEKSFYVIKGKKCIVVDSLDSNGQIRGGFGLHRECQGGSHYLADGTDFYIIRDNRCLCVRDMSERGYNHDMAHHFKLHESYANGLYYFATEHYFYVLKKEKDVGLVYYKTRDLSRNQGQNWFHVNHSVAQFLQGSTSFNQQTSEGIYMQYPNVNISHMPSFLWQLQGDNVEREIFEWCIIQKRAIRAKINLFSAHVGMA